MIDAATAEQIIERRQQRQTYRQIARVLGIGESTMARILKRKGLNRFAALSPRKADNRYEHDAPGISCIWTSRSLDASSDQVRSCRQR